MRGIHYKKIILIAVISFLLVSCVSLEKRIADAEMTMALSYREGDTKDTWNLRENADFEVEVYDGVWWVPAAELGKSRYTNEQIAAVVETAPELKKALISNLYEAIQLYQIGDFASDTDGDSMNVKVYDSVSSCRWEKHSPGYYAVLINRGNCSTDTNWLIYLLSDDYEEWGTFHYQRANGGGHVINYFVHDGYYYFIDMTHYRNDFNVKSRSAVEDGNYKTYRNTDYVSANIHKAVSPEAYVKYCQKSFTEPPVFFYMIKEHEVPDIASDKSGSKVRMILDSSVKDDTKVLYLDTRKMSYSFSANYSESVNWGEKSRHSFATKTVF